MGAVSHGFEDTGSGAGTTWRLLGLGFEMVGISRERLRLTRLKQTWVDF